MSLWNVKDCAEALGLSTSTIYTMVHERRIPYVKMGRLVRFDPDRIEKWINSQAKEPENVRERVLRLVG